LSNAVILGFVQGIFEWLPLSSEGLVAAVHTLLYDSDLGEGIDFALWLHVGTAPAALVALRSEVLGLTREVFARPPRLSPVFRYLVYSTAVSAVIGFPLLLMLSDLSLAVGGGSMAVIAAAMLVTGAVQLRRRSEGVRQMDGVLAVDGVLAGVAQGLSVVPGLSRSGLTVAVLLGRRLDRRDALTLSFLMSVPASLGAALYAAVDSSFELTAETLVAAVVAFAVGLVMIKLLLRLAARVNFAGFVFAVGLTMLAGSLWDLLR
jgi:undecaprenyl-diphosphatase